ncbi:MAG: hypothetical protein JRH01_23105 [Deltaproteobacteria bacterium]|nr:hypothetical protein [Deltaproteobacteria bacterium]MBW2394457.1 hypothetical protein [Deltaproteobacteria bacterium]
MSNHPAAMPHGPIEEIADGVFWVQGSIQLAPGMRLSRNMVIVRSGNDLTVASPVRLSEDGETELEKLGSVRHAVKLGVFHGVDDAYYLERFGATYWALPDGARPQDPTPQQVLRPDSLPIPDAELFEYQDSKEKEGALLIRRAGGILISCDAVQNWPDTKGCSLPAKLAAHLIGFRRRRAQIGPPWLKKMTPDGGSLKADFERLAKLDFAHLIGAHGAPLRDTAREDLQATIEATF